MNYLKHIYITLILTALASCGSETDEPAPVGPQTPISFGNSVMAIETEDGAGSRAAVMEEEDMVSFCVYGQLFDNGTFKGYMIPGERVTPAKKDDSWITENLYYWPDQSKGMSFFAYSPENVEGLKLLNPEQDPYNPRFEYEPPKDPKRQVDLLFANTNPYAPINYGHEPGRKVALEFRHRLIQINFHVNGDASKLATITLNNVTKKGIFNFQGTQWWELPHNEADSRTSYTINVPADGNFGDDHRLMIIPQRTPHDCTLEITFRDGTPAKSIAFGNKELDPKHLGGMSYRIVITV